MAGTDPPADDGADMAGTDVPAADEGAVEDERCTHGALDMA